jgi:hypothetical protein
MENNKLVPYSVHLERGIYDQLKIAAKNRKASALVRDAITMIIEGDDEFNGGYNKGIRDAISVIKEDELAMGLAFNGQTVADVLASQLEDMIVSQNVKGKLNGKKKV